jgi:hypothetical protein
VLVLGLAQYRGVMEVLCDVMKSPSVGMKDLCDAIIHLAQEGANRVTSSETRRFYVISRFDGTWTF